MKTPRRRRIQRIIHWLMGKRFALFVDYPVNSKVRYGWGLPPHPKLNEILESQKSAYCELLEKFVPLAKNMRDIQLGGQSPCWNSTTLPPLDAISIYGLVSINKPKIYMEVGSGMSTHFAFKAKKDHSPSTKIVCVDPFPRYEISQVADTVIRKSVENISLDIFDQLEVGDILFIDNSHCCFMNSDVTVAFLDILPRLKPGVIVGFHDINLPWDYPSDAKERWYSEQYVLAAHLLGGAKSTSVILPTFFCSAVDNKSRTAIQSIFSQVPQIKDHDIKGSGFWMKKAA